MSIFFTMCFYIIYNSLIVGKFETFTSVLRLSLYFKFDFPEEQQMTDLSGIFHSLEKEDQKVSYNMSE